MTILRSCFLVFIILCTHFLPETYAQSFSEKVGKSQKMEGFFSIFYNSEDASVHMIVSENQEFLYQESLSRGIGSNDIGLDRGQLGETKILKFERRGKMILLLEPNQSYRAYTSDALERLAVEEAFATSIIWSFPVEASEKDSYLINLTPFLLRDAHGVADQLKQMGEGSYAVDNSRSAVIIEGTKNFPQNTEIESMLTFKGNSSGRLLPSVVPDPNAITVRVHHSFVELPDDGYTPREADVRAGFFGISFFDFATPIDEPIQKRYIARHRLKKKYPNQKISEPVEPIVYYLDPGTPEPVRSALLDGARWWAQAFEAAGFKDAYKVEMLPADADPMDIRYNVIQWVHRSTRGWSYGSTVTDPRTGEIIKGKVSLGSLRVRQDYLLAQGILAPFDGTESPEMMEMALARLRQLSAHEVGHTLGISHNFAASSYGRQSVMDYPHPYITETEDGFDFSQAYATGMGDWDKLTVRFGYAEFASGTDENAALNSILEEGAEKGLHYISDTDARSPSGAHRNAHLWDNGNTPTQELERMISLRKKAIQNFSEQAIRTGRPLEELEDVFVPVYLMHRYQVEAASKMLGGVTYNYRVRGDNQEGMKPISLEEQKAAMSAILKTLSTEFLMLPSEVNDLFQPKNRRGRENFGSEVGNLFDELTAAKTSADITLSFLLHPQRLNRMMLFERQGKSTIAVSEMLNALHTSISSEIWNTASPKQSMVQRELLAMVHSYENMLLYDKDVVEDVKIAVISQWNQELKMMQKMSKSKDQHQVASARIIRTRLENAMGGFSISSKKNSAIKIPDGSPIGN